MIPSSVTTIGSYAFSSCDNLTRIVIPETVTNIEKRALGFYSSGASLVGTQKDLNLVIAGVKGSEAERYANENGFTFEEIIPITGIKISQTELVLEKGESKGLSISIEPEDTTEDKTVTWSSDNESVAKVGEDGIVTAVGNGKTKITATIGEYTQTCTVTVFTPLAEERVTISTDSAVYSGEEIRPSVTVKDGEKILEQDKDYTVGYENNINAGDATVKVTGIGDYTGTVSKGFKIQKAPIVDSMVTLKETTLVYTGKELTPEIVVKDGDRILVKDIDYILDYKNNIDVGTTAQVVVIGCGNYISGVTKEFEIVDTIQLSDSMVTLEKDEYSYTGEKQSNLL